MYTFSNRLKIFSIILIVLGVIGVGYGFMTSHKSLEEVKTMLSEEASHHGGGHAEEATHAVADTHGESAEAHHGDEHAEHVMHQIHNRPYAALYVAAFFFMMIALGVLAFYAIQIASQAGWSPVLFRVMEGITAYLLPGGLIVLAIAFFADSHLFIWLKEGMTIEGHENYDKLVAGKSGWLNKPWFFIRGLIQPHGSNHLKFRDAYFEQLSGINYFHEICSPHHSNVGLQVAKRLVLVFLIGMDNRLFTNNSFSFDF